MLQNLSIPCFQPQQNDRSLEEEEFSFRIIKQNYNRMPQISPNISFLDLTGNLFTSIPDQIYGLKLKKLILRENHIITLSPRIGELSDLLILDLSHNFIQNLPNEIAALHNLTHLNLNSNCLDEVPDALFNMKVRFLGIAKNSFQILPKQFLQMLISVEILDFDWLQYGVPKGLNEETKRLLMMTNKSLNFEQFYQVLNIDMKYQYSFEQIFQNQSLGILRSYYKLITFKNLIYCYHQQKTDENNRFIKYLIHLIQYQHDLLNTMFLLAFKFQNLDVFMYMLNNFQLDYHYVAKYDLLYNSHVILLRGQMLFTLILLNFNLYKTLLPLLMEKGFNPQHKTDKGNCLLQSVQAKNKEAVEWALKYCDQNSKEPTHGNSSLHLINSHIIDIIYLLFNSNGNPFSVNKFNKIPRQYVADVQQLSVYKIFQRYEKFFIKKHFNKEQDNCKHAMINYHESLSYQENKTLIILSKLLRTKFNSKKELIHNILQYYYFTEDEQSKLQTALIMILILNKLIYGLQYKSDLFSSILFQINEIHIFHLKYPLLNNIQTNQDYQYLIQKIQSKIKKQYVLQIQNVINPQHQSTLSCRLQYDLNNTIERESYQKIYYLNQQQFVYRSYINQYFIEQQLQEQLHTNLLVLDQYEQLQQHKKKHISIVNDFTTAMDSPRNTLGTQMENYSQLNNPKFKQFF